MELQYFGANCLRITTKKATIVVDDNLSKLGLKSISKPTDISLNTHAAIPAQETRFMINMPGEYEISGVVVHGIPARAHMDESGNHSAVIYTIAYEDLKVVILGHIYPELSDKQLEQIGLVDIAVIPVGNSGYTLDGAGALKLIKELEPKVIIPTHYADKAIEYEVPQVDLAQSLKVLAMEPSEPQEKYKPKAVEFTDTARLVILKRQ